MSGIFVTGADTEIGKTLVSCAFAHQLRRHGTAVRVMKPVISGFDAAAPEASDTGLLLAAAGQEITEETIAACSPWRYAAPIAPSMAAEREGRPIDMDELIRVTRAGAADPGFAVIEGVGGVMAPLAREATVLDWIAGSGLAAVVVTGSHLGALSHALTAVEALRARRIAISGVVVNESETSPVPLEESAVCLGRLLKGVAIATVRRVAPGPRPWERVGGNLRALARA